MEDSAMKTEIVSIPEIVEKKRAKKGGKVREILQEQVPFVELFGHENEVDEIRRLKGELAETNQSLEKIRRDLDRTLVEHQRSNEVAGHFTKKVIVKGM